MGLVGDGPFRPRLERIVQELGIRDRTLMTLRANDDELHAWYEAATLFVHPTLYEGSSLVTLEAMAHRRAVIATRAGGLPDKVHDGRNGWLVLRAEPTPLSSTIATALASLERLAIMGRVSRQIVEATFSWDVVTVELVQLFRELTERGERQPGLTK